MYTHVPTLWKMKLTAQYEAIEAQAFTVRNPGAFFNIYSPPRSDTSFKAMRDRLDEELRYMSKMVRRVLCCLTGG